MSASFVDLHRRGFVAATVTTAPASSASTVSPRLPKSRARGFAGMTLIRFIPEVTESAACLRLETPLDARWKLSCSAAVDQNEFNTNVVVEIATTDPTT
jgi:hypothetical protein